MLLTKAKHLHDSKNRKFEGIEVSGDIKLLNFNNRLKDNCAQYNFKMVWFMFFLQIIAGSYQIAVMKCDYKTIKM